MEGGSAGEQLVTQLANTTTRAMPQSDYQKIVANFNLVALNISMMKLVPTIFHICFSPLTT